MDKQAYLEEVYNESFKEELEKVSGAYSELVGTAVNPLNWLAAGPAAIAAAITPTKTKKQMVKQQKKTVSNYLLPGAGTYRHFKRLGYSAKGKYGPVVSESVGPSLNPLTKIIQTPAAIAAAVTPTLTKKEMSQQNKKTWSNALLPGAGIYRHYKRLGYTHAALNKEIAKSKKKKKK